MNSSEFKTPSTLQRNSNYRNHTYTPKNNNHYKYSKTIKSSENKLKFLVQIKDLNSIIKDNFSFEADLVFIVKNTPFSIRAAKQEFKNISYKFTKSKDFSFKLSFGLIFLDTKGDNLMITQPFKEFCKNSIDQFNNFIEVKFMGIDEINKNENFDENDNRIIEGELMKVLEIINKMKWTSKKARSCIFFTENESTTKTEEFLKKIEEIHNIKFFCVNSENEQMITDMLSIEENKENNLNDTIPIMRTIKICKNVFSDFISEEIQKSCMIIDLKIMLEEKTKKNPIFSHKSPKVNSSTSLQVQHFISTFPLELDMDPSTPNFNDTKYEVFEARAISFFIVKDKNIEIDWANPLIQSSNIETKVWICPKPFSQGSMRYAFYMKDVYLNEKLVGKIPKILDDNYNISCMKRDVESMIIFGHLVNEFNERMIWKFQSEDQTLLNVAHAYIYEILVSNYPYKYLWVENLLEGEYKKYNNNSGWQDMNEGKYNQLAQAFSHFSWQFTKGYLIIVDLQGPYGVFTDPQIHSLDIHKFGGGNFGNLGMIRFFVTHKCNKFCKALGLVHLNSDDKTEIQEDFWNKNHDLDKILENHEDLVRLCDLCRRPYKINTNEWIKKKSLSMREREDYCFLCVKKMDESKSDGGYCEECGKKFNYSCYWFFMKRTEKPTRCSYCRWVNRERERKKLTDK